MEVFQILSLAFLATTGIMTLLWLNERGNNQRVRWLFGKEFLKALKIRDGILFLKVDSSGDSDFKFVPWTNKDETFYYIEETRGDKKEKFHYKVRKKDLIRLRNRIGMAIIFEESIGALSPKVMQVLSGLSPFEKARFVNAYAKYRSLKATRERILQQLRYTSDKEKVEELKEQLKSTEDEMAEIKEKWSSIVQELDFDSTIIIPDEEGKRVIVLRPIDLDEMTDYLEATRPDELEYTAKKMFADWQMTALESLKKLVAPVDKLRKSRGSNWWMWIVLLLGGGLFLLFLLGMVAGG